MSRLQKRIREPFCGLSHLAGAIAGVAGLVILLVLARGRPLHTVGFAIYGASLILLYTASSLYHSLHVNDRGIELLKNCDHTGIYLLIAGTYTPVCLIVLRGSLGFTMLMLEYAMAGAGIAAILLWKSAPSWIRVVLYLFMGWLALIAIGPLGHAIPTAALWWLIAGGLFYTVGTVFYATEWPNLWPGRFHAHDLWHVFVLAGSTCHFVMMVGWVAA